MRRVTDLLVGRRRSSGQMSPTLQRSLNRLLAVLGAALLLAVGAGLAACGARDGEGAAAAPAGPAAPVDKVRITDFKFVPATITVRVGQKITWTNGDGAQHTATSGTPTALDGVFDTGTFGKGERKSVTVSKPGTFAYYCALHPFMKAAVIVR